MNNSTEASVLKAIFKSAQTGSQSITDIMPQVKDTGLREDLNRHREEYERISDEAELCLGRLGEAAKEPGAMQKFGMKMGIEMETALDTTASHIAEVMINGSTMGIINVTKIMNGYPNAEPDTRRLSERFINSERENIERMKNYLQ